jgi:DNA-directed RNA polymerase specialized sigma24 family protein
LSTASLVTTRSHDEIAEMMRSLTPSDWARLRKIARFYSIAGSMEADDLLQEAMMRALSTRECPVDVDVVRFLAQSMRSIANGAAAKMKRVAELAPVARTGDATEVTFDILDESNGPETILIVTQDADHCRATYAAIRALFEDDTIAKYVLEGLLEDMTPDEIRELTGLDKTGYDSKRKLIRRRIEKAYPKGWKP